MCFFNLTAKIIAKEDGIDHLIPTVCWGFPCIVIRDTGEHLHNIRLVSDSQQVRDVQMDMIDHDILLKLQGKSN